MLYVIKETKYLIEYKYKTAAVKTMGEKDMGKKKQKVLYDADGARRVMRKRDYMADMGGQLALGVMANLVGQLTFIQIKSAWR